MNSRRPEYNLSECLISRTAEVPFRFVHQSALRGKRFAEPEFCLIRRFVAAGWKLQTCRFLGDGCSFTRTLLSSFWRSFRENERAWPLRSEPWGIQFAPLRSAAPDAHEKPVKSSTDEPGSTAECLRDARDAKVQFFFRAAWAVASRPAKA